MFALSISHKTADASFRRSFCFDDGKAQRLIERLSASGIKQSVYLFTCNRCELYGVGDAYEALSVLSDFACAPMPLIKSRVLIFEGKSAVRHLFRVTGGFESMVLGEDEILGQVRRAYLFSKERGFTDYELNTVFQSAAKDAKRIKTETLLSKSSVSVSSLAASCCHSFKKGRKAVLVIGAGGEIGRKTVLNLLSYGDFDVFACVRQTHIDQSDITVIPYEKRYDYADAADIIISATKSPHFTVVAETLRQQLKTQKERLFIDLSATHDIDSAVAKIENARLITIDDFEKIAKENNELKQTELLSAQQILDCELDALFKELSFHGFLLKCGADIQKNGAFMQFLYKFRDAADSQSLDSFLGVLERMVENGDSLPVF